MLITNNFACQQEIKQSYILLINFMRICITQFYLMKLLIV